MIVSLNYRNCSLKIIPTIATVPRWLRSGRQLDRHLHERSANNFNLIRLIAAILIILGHCCATSDPIFTTSGGRLTATSIALPVFFFLSGLLVNQSLHQTTSHLRFLFKRFLRLYPAAGAVILIAAFLIGPLVSTLPPGTYFTHPLFFQYLRTVFLFRIYFHLPGVFTHSPLGPSVNSPLWSLALELKLYLGLFLLSFLGRKRLFLIALWAITLFLAAANLFPARFPFQAYPYAQLTAYFGIGALTWQYRNHITIHNYWLPALPVAWWLSMHLPHIELTMFILIPFTVLYVAVHPTKAATNRQYQMPDLSYGIYCWGFLIEQLIVNYLNPHNRAILFGLNLLLVLPPALLSWYAIESKALKLKRLSR